MLLMPRSCFLHVPKTGGSWVRKAIKSTVTGWRELIPDGNMHLPLAEIPERGLFRFAFVRHPVEVYRSLWQYKMTVGWDPDNVLDRNCGHDDFSRFVQSRRNSQIVE